MSYTICIIGYHKGWCLLSLVVCLVRSFMTVIGLLKGGYVAYSRIDNKFVLDLPDMWWFNGKKIVPSVLVISPRTNYLVAI